MFIKNGCFNPFVIGIFCGNSKPDPLNLYLEDFVNELSELLENGIVHKNLHYYIRIHSFICDAPAKAYIKCVKSHGGYASCDKCTEYGQYVNDRVILSIPMLKTELTIHFLYKLTKVIILVSRHLPS